MIDIRHVSFAYSKGKDTLKDICLNFNQEWFPVALIGPNGTGKTTLLKLISGILTPNTGSITVDGYYINKLRDKQRAALVGVLFPDRVNSVAVSVLDVVLSGAYRYEIGIWDIGRAYRNHAEDVMKRIGILHLRDRMFSTLSSGERQLVLLAMILVQSPKIILMDEPTSFLDPLHRYMLVDIIRNLSRDHKIIFTSHDVEFIKAVSRFAVGMKNGRIYYTGETERFLEEAFAGVFGIPYNRYTSVFRL